MKLAVFTIVKDGMPFLPTVFFNLQATKLDWHWIVAEGSSLNSHCTGWCSEQAPGLSTDGTTEFLNIISKHPRVSVVRKELWDGKVAMCNACLAFIKEPCVLLQMDADELWRPDVIERLVRSFELDVLMSRALFKCRYFLGVNIVSTSRDGYGNRAGEWARAWRFTPGDKFERHEPPQLNQNYQGYIFQLEGIHFDHFAWWHEGQAGYKELFYGYPGALSHWKALQENRAWPIEDLRKFLPWVGPGGSADILAK